MTPPPPPSASQPKSSIDIVTAFEYPTFRLPYEVLNQGFRNLHREMEHKRSMVRRTMEKVEFFLSGFEGGNKPIELDKVVAFPMVVAKDRVGQPVVLDRKATFRQEFERAYRAWKAFHDSVRAAMSQMDWYTESFLATIARLRLESRVNRKEYELARWRINRDRTCRIIASYLMRCGRLQTAQALSIKTGILPVNVHELNQFTEAQNIYEALKYKQDTHLVTLWCDHHRQKLRKMKSKLELAVRVQDTIDFIKMGEKYAALKYARTFLKITDFNEYTKEEIKEINQVWALIGLTQKTSIAAYAAVLDESRYDRLAELFKEEFTRLFDLPYQSAFSLCLQCGLAAYKTPQCTPGGHPRCITCQPSTFILAEGLPHAHTGLSIIRCAFSGDLLNEDNPPWIVMKTGRVYGERSLNQLTREDKFHCIKTKEWVSIKDLQRIYIL